MEEKFKRIKKWLGTASVNIFGLPMSGKDTVGIRLAEELDGKFLSSGIIIRSYEAEKNDHMTESGELIPTNKFYDIVLPYFSREDLRGYPLVLSSIGRWSGEEDEVMRKAEETKHEIKAVVYLKLSEEEVRERWKVAKTLGDRGIRGDDADPKVFETRIEEFHEKTRPVLEHYKKLGLLLEVDASGTREEVFENVIDALAKKA
ncbi:MAG: nucleoside monophosphate kinase [Candidatus Saccharibacteria bacterium]|nr:nucleoside monophosphate kinase [Candidatus Saccharibacteria bacterium]